MSYLWMAPTLLPWSPFPDFYFHSPWGGARLETASYCFPSFPIAQVKQNVHSGKLEYCQKDFFVLIF